MGLAAILTQMGEKVLVIDFELQQGDLTNSLRLQLGKIGLYNCLTDNVLDIYNTIKPFAVNLNLERNSNLMLSQQIQKCDYLQSNTCLQKLTKVLLD